LRNRYFVMLNLLGVVRPRWSHLPLGRSRRADLDIVGHIFFENLLTQQGPSHTLIGLRSRGGNTNPNSPRLCPTLVVTPMATDPMTLAGGRMSRRGQRETLLACGWRSGYQSQASYARACATMNDSTNHGSVLRLRHPVPTLPANKGDDELRVHI
jgi:hypothetical protein